MALPTLFPRVRILELKNGDVKCGNQIGEEDTRLLEAAIMNWKNVEKIMDSSDFMNVTIRLLGILKFDHLTGLDLCFCRKGTIPRQRYKSTRALTRVVDNAPSLEKPTMEMLPSRLKTSKICMQEQQN